MNRYCSSDTTCEVSRFTISGGRGNSKKSSKESYGSNDMAHKYYLEEAKKKTQDKNTNLKPREMPSDRTHHTPNASCVDHPVLEVAALVFSILTSSPSSTSVDQDAPLLSTSQTPQASPSYVITTGTNGYVYSTLIRSDSGTEFKNSIMNQFCEMKGIKREFSVARKGLKRQKEAKTDQKPTRNERDKNKSKETAKDQSRINPTQK
ncbi:uncharacterized mitochondrial protein-like protein [Tanacetum coccineum]